MDDHIIKNVPEEVPTDIGKMAPAPFIDSRLVIVIGFVVIASIAATAVITTFQGSLGTVTYGGKE